jgi:diadenosine tetraphosphate (Ap4A) HIT family hydrolase
LAGYGLGAAHRRPYVGSDTTTSCENGRVIEMKLPYKEPLVPAEPAERVIPEPPRRGEPGGEPCGICTGAATSAVWSNDFWTLHPPVSGSLAGAVWLASRKHVDSFADLPKTAAEDFGKVAGKVERAILSLGGIARVHLNRWGDGGAHFHVWFIPRPLGMLDAQGMMLPLWEDVLPNVPDEQLREAAERVAAMMDSELPATAAGSDSTGGA